MSPEAEDWRSVIGSDLVDREGPLAANRRLLDALHGYSWKAGISPLDVYVVGRRDPLVEAQPGCLMPATSRLSPADQQAVACQGFGVRISLGDRLFDQPQGLVRLSPGLQGWPRQARPPGLVLEAECPVRVGFGQVDQAVAGCCWQARQRVSSS